MRSRVEQVLNRTLKGREAPSKALVATKLEQLEDGVPKAEDLQDVTSYEDVEGEAYSAIIDPATAMLRIKPGRASTIPRDLQKSFDYAIVASAWLGILSRRGAPLVLGFLTMRGLFPCAVGPCIGFCSCRTSERFRSRPHMVACVELRAGAAQSGVSLHS